MLITEGSPMFFLSKDGISLISLAFSPLVWAVILSVLVIWKGIRSGKCDAVFR